MLKGIHLTLMMGPVVPIPVSKEIVDALTSVQVSTSTQGASGFQLSFELSTKSPLHIAFLLSGGNPIPIVRVIIIVTINGTPEVLIDGTMTNHQVSPGSSPSTSNLTISGEDLSRVMDYIDFSGIPYPAMPPSARVLLILAKYAFLGILPKVLPSPLLDVPNPLDRIPRQKGKDLSYIKQLADLVGYVFYMEPGPTPGVSFAYWGPEIKVGAPQPALNVDMDAHTNVESLSFSFNSEMNKIPVVYIQNPQTKLPIPIPIPDITPLSPPLGVIPPIPKNLDPITETAKYNPVQGALIGMARAAESADAVTGSGSLDVLRYGRRLQARKLVGVRGAGHAYNGLHYVESVTDNIKRGEYKQSFTLSRNGLLSTIPRVSA
ncbi:MAG: hypothetical protein QNL62_16615 [Gammaproteobacteria bacterium]|nr:hypothetical protein [Gammaproteobacteria bacterium]